METLLTIQRCPFCLLSPNHSTWQRFSVIW